MAEIPYTCKRTVVSTKPVQPGKRFPLSVLDRLMEPRHLRIVYYYRSGNPGRKAGEWTRTLRESLARTLTSFPKATGRLQRDGEGRWEIECNDAGVRAVEARARGSVEDWLRNAEREDELRLVHWEEMFDAPYFWSTFYVQMTEFEGGGFAIGLSCIHLLADPICATMFIKAWADMTLKAQLAAPPLFHPLPKRQPGHQNEPNHNTSLINHYKSSINTPSPAPGAKFATLSLSFAEPIVRSCVAAAQPVDQHVHWPGLSPFKALAGLFWACISKVRGNREGLVSMCLGLDVRKLLGLEREFFGNCMVYSNSLHAGDNEEDNSLPGAAKAIGEIMAKLDKNGVMDLIGWLELNDISHPESARSLNFPELLFLNLEGIGPHTARFEHAHSPIQVSCYFEPPCGQGQVVILPSATEDAPMSRVVMVTLREDELAKLLEDDLLKSFSPTILMGVNRNRA
ncbi:protein ECERIFERUM 26-like [Rhodamnia argentea]|uniref:Protein ECERIFERUM 26-like n=1 Tax=Rhodamnia argentea TaxID=178133 RepID=A0A8B8Q995_9MYRT|nr:protein ECERIFERUM 26-like [Rhodamnia argentea]